eukprot:Protomagalhaensia_sp_Gyna_25__4978@NODE_544_length_3160_cov_26_090676_g425_i0_p3_GENE_NODE_544_length_3160_cov_26_090676_g425_i0NODE_544_length_3160_cov_26_090676_g425_i0_p3_ORF_typecomplete_len118_score19_06Choline_kinase/PF01633_20/0_15Med28/PF11594_8/0_25LRRFIP/PF09738_9/0_19NYDSP28_assoc/PF14775_6/3_8_NODE_544_length_3160_cov_26_090676_g425_i027823135
MQTNLGSPDSGGLPPGVLPLLIEKMVQLDDLKALENNTLEMWRAMARYELQKEEEIRLAKERERAELLGLQQQNLELRTQLQMRESMMGLQNQNCCCVCDCVQPSPKPSSACSLFWK